MSFTTSTSVKWAVTFLGETKVHRFLFRAASRPEVCVNSARSKSTCMPALDARRLEYAPKCTTWNGWYIKKKKSLQGGYRDPWQIGANVSNHVFLTAQSKLGTRHRSGRFLESFGRRRCALSYNKLYSHSNSSFLLLSSSLESDQYRKEIGP